MTELIEILDLKKLLTIVNNSVGNLKIVWELFLQ